MANEYDRELGPERLTHPREISALSKYLKEIKAVQEEHTELDSSVLGVSGSDTGKIPEVGGLYDAILGLEVTQEDNLVESRVSLPVETTAPHLVKETREFPSTPQEVGLNREKATLSIPSEPELEKGKAKLSVQSDIALNKGRADLVVPSDIKLNIQRTTLSVDNDIELSSGVSRIAVTEPDKLSDGVSRLGEITNPDLEKEVSFLVGEIKNPDLSTFRDGLVNDLEPDLYDAVVGLSVDTGIALPTEVEGLSVDTGISLPTEVDGLEVDTGIALSTEVEGLSVDTKIKLPTEVDKLLEDVLKKSSNFPEDKLYEYTLKLLTSEESTETEKKIATLFSTYLSNNPTPLSIEEVGDYEEKLVEYSKIQDQVALKLLQEEDKLKGQYEEHFSGPRREKVLEYKLPDWTLGWNGSDVVGSVYDVIEWSEKLDVNSYIRWSVENTIGKINTSGSTRQALIDETLALLVAGRRKLEVLSGVNRDRLPGQPRGKNGENARNIVANLLTGGVDAAVTSLTNVGLQKLTNLVSDQVDLKELKSALDEVEDLDDSIKDTILSVLGEEQGRSHNTQIPSNRPDKHSKTTVFDDASGRVNANEIRGRYSYSRKNINRSNFRSSYLSGDGIKTTIEELAEKDITSIYSVEDLLETLRDSPRITTVSKFGSSRNRTDIYTLDGNGYWEIVIEPYVGDLNGGFSFLPAFSEIDTWNYRQHGVLTYHNGWIPFTGFELQKSRLVAKSLGLYAGEITYPIAEELTNELRISIADDNYKSWRWYFQRCMEASVFSSTLHFSDYYHQTGTPTPITAIDKSVPLVAYYKNIAFNIRVYVMTPQFSTIKKYDLLCVLREFSEDWIGEVDHAGAPDLSLAFSVVGEVPPKIIENISETPKNYTTRPVLTSTPTINIDTLPSAPAIKEGELRNKDIVEKSQSEPEQMTV